jgi:hypothetical protein
MLRVNQYEIRFFHLIPGSENYKEMRSFIKERFLYKMKKGTVCVIVDTTTEIELLGRSFIHKGDPFSRVQGRKYALTRALSILDKSTRALIWEEYKKTYRIV